MKEYQFILFDWDGCLAKTLEVWLDAYKTALAELGVKPEDEEIAHHFGDWDLPKYFGVKDFEKCNTDAVEIARQNLKTVELYEGARELLDALRPTKKLALLSSASKDILLSGVGHNQLAGYFDVILSGEDVANHKPHPEVIESGLAALNGSKDRAVMIGDSRKDLGAAQNAGVDSILIYPESHKIFYNLDDLRSYQPTFTVSSIKEVTQLLAGPNY